MRKRTKKTVLALVFGCLAALVPLWANGGGEDIDASVADGLPTLSVWRMGRPEAELSSELPVITALEKKLNLRFDFTLAPTSNENELFNIYMAAGAYSDVTIKTLRELMDYASMGLWAPIEEEYAPNIVSVIQEYPSELPRITGEDGKRYVVPRILQSTENYGWFIRKDWLDALDLSVPQTPEEWYTVLKAFKEGDPNGNGKADEVPFTARAAGTDRGTGWVRIGRANYIPFLYAWKLDEAFTFHDGKFTFGAMEPRFKEYLVFMRRLFEEGWIEFEYVSFNKNQWAERLTTEQAGATFDWLSRISRFQHVIRENNPDASFIGTAPIVMEKGEVPFFYKGRDKFSDASAGAVYAQSENLEKAFEFLDYLYTVDGEALASYGIENSDFIWKGDRLVQFTEKITDSPDGLSKQVVRYRAGMVEWPIGGLISEISTADPEEQAARAIYRPLFSYRPPFVPLSQEEKDFIAEKMNDVNTYMDEVIDKIIMGIQPLSEHDEMVRNLGAMGVPEMVEIYQRAYDRSR